MAMTSDTRARVAFLLVLLVLLVFGGTLPAESGVGPDWLRSGFGVSAPPAGCQYRFNALGGLDELSVAVTLRDAFDVPAPGHEISVRLESNSGTLALCGCESLEQSAITDSDGICTYSFSRLGGHGSLDVDVSVDGGSHLFREAIVFTTPDLDGSCDQSPTSSTGIIDLAMWASGLDPYRQASDYDCDGWISVIDMGIWTSGLGNGCP